MVLGTDFDLVLFLCGQEENVRRQGEQRSGIECIRMSGTVPDGRSDVKLVYNIVDRKAAANFVSLIFRARARP